MTPHGSKFIHSFMTIIIHFDRHCQLRIASWIVGFRSVYFHEYVLEKHVFWVNRRGLGLSPLNLAETPKQKHLRVPSIFIIKLTLELPCKWGLLKLKYPRLQQAKLLFKLECDIIKSTNQGCAIN